MTGLATLWLPVSLLDLLTLGLLAVPPEVPLPVPTVAHPILWGSLKRVAGQIEIVGPAERWATDYASEVGYCRRHWAELHEAPSIADVARLPSEERTDELLAWWTARHAYLDCRRHAMAHHWDALTDQMESVSRAIVFWGHVREAQTSTTGWATRRRAMLRVREAVGVRAWYEGRIP